MFDLAAAAGSSPDLSCHLQGFNLRTSGGGGRGGGYITGQQSSCLVKCFHVFLSAYLALAWKLISKNVGYLI